MHRCLQIPEILVNICRYLYLLPPQWIVKGRRVDLLAFALVCKAFLEPSLGVLWESEGSFPRLIKTFPTDVWRQRGYTPTISIIRPLIESDWERFDFYAKRIRRLETRPNRPGPAFDLSVFRAIELSRRPLPLLPNLQRLDTLSSNCHPLWNVAPLLGPKLKHFSLQVGTGDGIFERVSVLASLKVHSPFLESLEVSDPTEQLSSVISGTICSLQHLRVLKLGATSLTPECINHLSTLSNLTDLEVIIAENSVMQAPSPSSRATLFPALQALVILTHLWATADAFFEAYLQPASLERVEFQVNETPTNGHFHRLFTMMRKCCSLGSLTGITLSPQTELADYMTDNVNLLSTLVLDPSILHMLFAFANLEVLRIKTLTSFAKVDNTLINDMALAWPGLKSLEIRHSPTSQHTTSVTIHGLLPLASCSSLEQLFINIDPTIQDALPQLRQGQGLTSLCLVDLELGQSPIRDPYAVASFLSNVFPLANIDTNYSVEDEDEEDEEDEDESVAKRWAQVKILFHQFVKLRIREKWSEIPDEKSQCVARLLHAEGDGTQQAELMVE